MKRLIRLMVTGLLITTPLIALVPTVYAASATMRLSPASGSVAKGSIISVGVRENSGSEPVNAAKVTLSYPADKFDFISTSNSSAFGIVAASSGGGGTVSIDRGALPAVSGDQLIATVRFRAKLNTGTASVNISSGQVLSSNTNGNILAGTSGGSYALTDPPPPAVKDTVAPTIKDVSAVAITTNSAVITWTSSEPATSEVSYGLNQGYGLSAVDATPVTAHKLTLSSPVITPGTTYHYIVKSVDPAGNAVSGNDATFTTKGATLVATVLNQKNGKPLKGAKIEFGNKSAKTDKKGQASLYDLPLGKQTGTITYKGKANIVKINIVNIEPKGAPTTATFKIPVPASLLWLVIPSILLLLLFAWWLGKEEGEGQHPLTRLKMGSIGRLSNRWSKKGGPNEPPSPPNQPNNNPPPTIIRPSGPPA